MLDEAGWTECKITVSNSLDEILIQDLLLQGAQIDSFGVGERLITARSEPVFGGVYKLVAFEDEQGNVVPKIKLSENVAKITTPHYKKQPGRGRQPDHLRPRRHLEEEDADQLLRPGAAEAHLFKRRAGL